MRDTSSLRAVTGPAGKSLSAWIAATVLILAAAGCSSSSAPDDGAGSSTAETRTVDAEFHTLRTPALTSGQFELMTLSTMPDTVTGGDVLVAVRGLASNAAFQITRNGQDVTSAFSRVANSTEIRGLVTGLNLGDNALTARSGGHIARLTVRNHPVAGPVISGPHQTPFVCETEVSGLGAPLDADCSIQTKYQWFYRSALTQSFTELADPYAAYPADVLGTQLENGSVVPYVVRVESATINRGIARIAVLDDPHSRGANAAFAPNWNHRVYYAFGESAGPGYHQGMNLPSYVLGSVVNFASDISTSALLINLVGIDQRLGKGDVVVHSTLSAYGNHANPLISIETAMMVKEHIIENYGLIDYVVGTNGSGAALQQYNALNNAPGLLDAALPTATFADIPGTGMTVVDCGLLKRYYENSSRNWTIAKRAAVNGHSLTTSTPLNDICDSWSSAFLPAAVDPVNGCSGAVPRELRYDAATNPRGARCKIADGNVNILGRDPVTGFARDAIENRGIQYGLDALNAGTISFDDFIDLNRTIGGFDADGRPTTQRIVMDPQAADILYRIGMVVGRGAMAETPVMDLAPYLDLIPGFNIHESVRPFIIRARLRQYSGEEATQSIWRGVAVQPDAYPLMAQWLDALKQTRPGFGGDQVKAVIDAKPAAIQDRCVVSLLGSRLELPNALLLPLGIQAPLLTTTPLLRDLVTTIPGLAPLLNLIDLGLPVRIDLPEQFSTPTAPGGVCQTLLPPVRTPRMAAGGPLTDDVIKCQLKPVDPADYGVPLTSGQLAQIGEVFPEGVCDWRRPAAAAIAHSVIWPSIGGATLSTDGSGNTVPVGLKWRVARSQ